MRGRSPWTPEGGLGCARTGVLRRAEEVRLVSPGAEQSRRDRISAWGLSRAQAGQPGMALELSVMSLPPGWTETYDFWWLGSFPWLVLSAYLSHLSLWRGRAITYSVQNRERNKTSSTGGPEPVPFKESRGALQDEVGVGPGTSTNASRTYFPGGLHLQHHGQDHNVEHHFPCHG